MSFNVRVFGFPGIEQMPNVLPKQYSADSIYTLVQPYLWNETISVSAAAVSSSVVSTSQTRVLRVEVPDAQAVRYEINPPNRPGGAVAANSGSPILQGHDQFYFMPGWSISFIDASGLP